MKKVKCEICGEMVPQNEMSKSYRHRCKKCVADMTRALRHAEKQKKDAQKIVPHTYEAPAPYGEGPLNDALPKMSEKEFDETISLAIETYGKEAQTQILFEEMAELQNALCKLARGRGTADQVCEEIADVMIMCLQMAQLYGPKDVEWWANYKITRLKDRLNVVNRACEQKKKVHKKIEKQMLDGIGVPDDSLKGGKN